MIADLVKSTFKQTFEQKPLMIFSPGRLNIIGEHTDYNDGYVFPAAIDKGIYAAFGNSNTNLCIVNAMDMGETYEFSLDHITPLAQGSWKNYVLGVVFEIQKLGKMIKPFHLTFSGDIPGGAGLSSSAALENAIVYGLNELYQLALLKNEMILISQKAEHNFVGVKCGIMDQYASMFGQKNKALLLDCRSIIAEPFAIDLQDYEFLLINTNVKHSLDDSAYNNRREVCEKVAALLKVVALRDLAINDLISIKDAISKDDFQMALYVIEENERTQKAGVAMRENNIIELGNLLYQSHLGLQHQYKVSCDELDFLVDLTKKNNKIAGARMMGGGFGGCTINLIKKDAVASFSKHVTAAYQEKFGYNCSIYHVNLSQGTHLMKDKN